MATDIAAKGVVYLPRFVDLSVCLCPGLVNELRINFQ